MYVYELNKAQTQNINVWRVELVGKMYLFHELQLGTKIGKNSDWIYVYFEESPSVKLYIRQYILREREREC